MYFTIIFGYSKDFFLGSFLTAALSGLFYCLRTGHIQWPRNKCSRVRGDLMFVCQHNGVATSALVLFGAGEDTIVKITGLITSVGAVVAYILAEAHVDAQAAQKGESDDAK